MSRRFHLIYCCLALLSASCGTGTDSEAPTSTASPLGRDFSNRCEQSIDQSTNAAIKPTTRPVDDRAAPFAAVAKISLQDGSICSSVLVTRSQLVTAAHCLTVKNPPLSAEFVYDQKRTVVSLRDATTSVHPDYLSSLNLKRSLSTHPAMASFDVGIINLTKQITDIDPVTISTQTSLSPGKLVGLIGFGDTGAGTGTKRFAYSHVGSTLEKEVIGNVEFSNVLALNSQSGTGACPGDSGGGVFVKHDDRWELVSLISGVNDVVYPGFPISSCNRCPNGIGLGPLAAARLSRSADLRHIDFK
jgi:hypothetical protein